MSQKEETEVPMLPPMAFMPPGMIPNPLLHPQYIQMYMPPILDKTSPFVNNSLPSEAPISQRVLGNFNSFVKSFFAAFIFPVFSPLWAFLMETSQMTRIGSLFGTGTLFLHAALMLFFTPAMLDLFDDLHDHGDYDEDYEYAPPPTPSPSPAHAIPLRPVGTPAAMPLRVSYPHTPYDVSEGDDASIPILFSIAGVCLAISLVAFIIGGILFKRYMKAYRRGEVFVHDRVSPISKVGTHGHFIGGFLLSWIAFPISGFFLARSSLKARYGYSMGASVSMIVGSIVWMSMDYWSSWICGNFLFLIGVVLFQFSLVHFKRAIAEGPNFSGYLPVSH